MGSYRPQKSFNTPMFLYVVTGYKEILGVEQPIYSEEGILFNGSFATYGGTERVVNGISVVEDTAVIETWFRPDFAVNCHIALANNQSAVYEIIGNPENIEQRNQFCKFKVKRVTGGA